MIPMNYKVIRHLYSSTKNPGIVLTELNKLNKEVIKAINKVNNDKDNFTNNLLSLPDIPFLIIMNLLKINKQTNNKGNNRFSQLKKNKLRDITQSTYSAKPFQRKTQRDRLIHYNNIQQGYIDFFNDKDD